MEHCLVEALHWDMADRYAFARWAAFEIFLPW